LFNGHHSLDSLCVAVGASRKSVLQWLSAKQKYYILHRWSNDHWST
jgi:hypothetical protein